MGRLAARYLELLPRVAAGEKLSATEKFRVADEVFGGTRAQGAYESNQADEALEAAVNQFLQNQTEPRATPEEAAAQVQTIRNLTALLPTQTLRGTEKEALQQ